MVKEKSKLNSRFIKVNSKMVKSMGLESNFLLKLVLEWLVILTMEYFLKDLEAVLVILKSKRVSSLR
jgi:hypothetical protein